MAEWECPVKDCTKRLDASDLEVFRVAVASHMKSHGLAVQVQVAPAQRRRELARDEVGEIIEDTAGLTVGHYVTVTETGSSSSGGFWRGFLDAFSFGGGSSSSGGSSKGSGGGGGSFLDDLFG